MRSSVEEEEEEDCEETQPSKQHAVNGNTTNGVLEEGSPSEYPHLKPEYFKNNQLINECVITSVLHLANLGFMWFTFDHNG